MARAMSSAIDTTDVDLAFRLLLSVPPAQAQFGFGLRLPAGPVLALPAAPQHPEYALGLACAAWDAASSGDLQLGEQLSRQAIEAEQLPGASQEGKVAYVVAATRSVLDFSIGAWHDAGADYELASECAASAGQPSREVFFLCSAAQCHAMAGEFEHAAALATEVVGRARQLGLPHLTALGSIVLANALAEPEPGRARQLLQGGIELTTTLGAEDTAMVTVALLAAAHLRDRGLTVELAPRSVRLLHWNGDRPQLAGLLNVIAWAAEADPEAAARLQGAARGLSQRDGPLRGAQQAPPAAGTATARGTAGVIGDLRRETTARLTDRLGDARLRELRAEGEAMDIDQAVRFALALLDTLASS